VGTFQLSFATTMMKNIALVAGLGLASAVPRISLDLGATSFTTGHASTQPASWPKSSGVSTVYKLASPIQGEHDKGYAQPDGTKVKSRQDFTERCPAGGVSKSTSPTNCKIPSASATDHHEGNIAVETRVFLVNDDGVVKNEEVGSDASAVNFDKRSTYLFKYDAKDASGNRADQLVFALILDDTTKPEIIGTCADETVNAATGTCDNCSKEWKICSSDIATDNVDGVITDRLEYTIERLNGDADPNTPCPVSAPCNKAAVEVAISTLYQAQYFVTSKVTDSASWYGHGFASNFITKTRTVTVTDASAQDGGDDTNLPIITMHAATNPASPSPTNEVHECATSYSDEGAHANDKLDDALNAGNCAATNSCVTVGVANHVPDYVGATGAPATGQYLVTYSASDSHSNAALKELRNVNVVDTTDPVISLVADALTGEKDTIDHRASATNQAIGEVSNDGTGALSDPGVTCVDTCDKTTLPITTSWGAKVWNPQVVGCYVRNYVCTDKGNNKMDVDRTFCNVDQDAPIITLNKDSTGGEGTVIREASADGIYTDAGAACKDFHNHNVNLVLDQTSHSLNKENTFNDALNTGELVTGDIVDLKIPATYTITYKCTDGQGRPALDASRKVVVKDTIPPVITRVGEPLVYIEAGFKYTDAGATASDTLDGVITSKITKTVKTLEGSNSFAGLVSSTEIAVPKVGKFEISYHVKDLANNDEAQTIKRTVVVQDTLPPVITLKVGSTLYHTSDATATGVKGVTNPAGTAAGNPNIDRRLRGKQ